MRELVNFLLVKMTIWMTVVKGTVSRDISSPIIFINRILLVQIGTFRNDFDFKIIFGEFFVFAIDSPVTNTPGNRLESLGKAVFSKISHMSLRS
jgi:hypothetical protein